MERGRETTTPTSVSVEQVVEAEEAEADGERGDRERDRGLYQRVNQSPFRFSIVQTPLQTNFDVHRQCPRNVDLPPPPLSHPNLAPLTECLSASSWFRVPSDNQVVESPLFSTTRFLLPRGRIHSGRFTFSFDSKVQCLINLDSYPR